MQRSVPNSAIVSSTTSRQCGRFPSPEIFTGRVRACGERGHGATPAAKLLDVGQAGVIQYDGRFREVCREARRLLELAPGRLQLEVQAERREARIALAAISRRPSCRLRLVADAAHERVARLRLAGSVRNHRGAARLARSRRGEAAAFRTWR
jgi:hypothetical protein